MQIYGSVKLSTPLCEKKKYIEEANCCVSAVKGLSLIDTFFFFFSTALTRVPSEDGEENIYVNNSREYLSTCGSL